MDINDKEKVKKDLKIFENIKGLKRFKDL